MPPRALWKIRPSRVVPYRLMWARSSRTRTADGDGAGLVVGAVLQAAFLASGALVGLGPPGPRCGGGKDEVTRASATDRGRDRGEVRPFGLGDLLVFGDRGFGEAGAGVEGPQVADRVLQLGEEPVGQRAGLERLAVLTAVDRPPDPVAGCGAAAGLLDVPELMS
jgi:hypothetical protein